MRAGSRKLRWLTGLVLTVAGCHSTPELKPAKQQECYGLPAANDERYNRPPDYPKNRFEEDIFKAKQESDPANMLGKPGGPPGAAPHMGY